MAERPSYAAELTIARAQVHDAHVGPRLSASNGLDDCGTLRLTCARKSVLRGDRPVRELGREDLRRWWPALRLLRLLLLRGRAMSAERGGRVTLTFKRRARATIGGAGGSRGLKG